MASIVKKLYDQQKLECDPYISTTQYEVITGSYAYNVSQDLSDTDIYGWCIPPKRIVFPQEQGIIQEFDDDYERFDQYQKHHIMWNEKEYDITIFNIVKYFKLCMENNPNMIDTLFVPESCVIHSSDIGRYVRSKRNVFIHKGCFHKFRGYAFSQLSKAKNKKPEGKRVAIVEKFGFDVKFASHIIRLSDECEQLLLFGTMDVTRSCEMQKAIRRGEMPLEEIEKWFHSKERDLEKLYNDSTAIPYQPDKDVIRDILFNCLEMHFGSIEKFNTQSQAERKLDEIRKIIMDV